MGYYLGGRLHSVVQIAVVCALTFSAINAQVGTDNSVSGSEGNESCVVSDGDKSFGIQAVADLTCVDGGLGCYNDHCRYCKVLDTLQSAHFESCSSLGVEFPTIAPVTISTGSSARQEAFDFEAATASICNLTATDGDLAVGISITSDTSCAGGGAGCIDSVCRFCRATNTTQSAHLTACPVITKVCTTTVSDGDAAVGIKIVTDPTCTQGGVGCIDNICRFCRASTTPQSSAYVECALIPSSTSATQAPVATTTPAPTTIVPAISTPPPTTATKQTCTQTVSDGDAAVGIKIVTDSSCTNGGVGCLDQVCRFCRVTTTAQSASFVDCTTIEGTVSSTEVPVTTPAPTTAVPTTAPPTTLPPTISPTKTPASTTVVPQAASPAACNITAAAGDMAAGISITTDASCAAGGLGCIDNVCRFCKLTATAQSASYVDCASITGTTTQPPPTTPTPTLPPSTTATSSTPSIVFVCSRTVSSGDKGVGLDIVSDIRCSEGGTGCLNDVCRFCKRFDTVQSQSYLDCSSVPSADVGSDINFVPIVIVDDSPAPTRRLDTGNNYTGNNSESIDASTDNSYESAEPTTTKACAMTVSEGDAAVGINIVTDTTCASGGTGCIDSVCRYCKTKDTTQAAHLTSCPSSNTARATGTSTTTKCTSTVGDGDTAVGINIITDFSCANGGLGCMDSVCRICKTKSTDQSAHLGDCSDYTSTASPSVAPTTNSAAPTTTTSTYSIPLNCYQTATSGDKGLGLDIVSDLRCGDGGVGCVDSICRFCKRFETTQSHSYMNCSEIPSSENGADITFKAITTIEDSHELFAEEDIVVSMHESTEFTPETDELCANVSLADGQAAGGIGVVLDIAHCPEGLASGCIGDVGCRYCMRFPTNISEYLDYCTMINGSSVAYDLSGTTTLIEGGRTLSGETPNAVSVEEKAPSSKNLEGATENWAIGGVACVGIAAVGLALYGIKRGSGSLSRSGNQSLDKEKVSPDDENHASVLVASNVGEPGVIQDV